MSVVSLIILSHIITLTFLFLLPMHKSCSTTRLKGTGKTRRSGCQHATLKKVVTNLPWSYWKLIMPNYGITKLDLMAFLHHHNAVFFVQMLCNALDQGIWSDWPPPPPPPLFYPCYSSTRQDFNNRVIWSYTVTVILHTVTDTYYEKLTEEIYWHNSQFLCADKIFQILNFSPVLGFTSVRLEGQVT